MGHILKESDVKLEGKFHLDAGQTMPKSANKTNIRPSEPQVRIVENQREYVIMELTCRCGTKTHIRCEYTEAQSAQQETAQAK